jgi:hypothetical protein
MRLSLIERASDHQTFSFISGTSNVCSTHESGYPAAKPLFAFSWDLIATH